MPSFRHEGLVELFRNRPVMAAEMLREALGVSIPTFTEVRIEPADLSDIVPRELRADLVVLLVDDKPVLVIVVEAQLQTDPKKRFAWPGYLVGARLRYGCSASVLVVSPDAVVAAWCAETILLGPCGSTVQPLVLGPGAVPVVKDAPLAKERPELAVLSAMAHGRSEEVGLQVALAALTASAGLDPERSALYADLVLSALSEAVRRTLEKEMTIRNYEYQSDFARKYFAQGVQQGAAEAKAKAVLEVFDARGLPVPEEVRQRVLATTDLPTLDHWLRRAVLVASASELFEKAS
jgi:hypothetical protein